MYRYVLYIASEVIVNGPRESLMLVLNGHIGRTIYVSPGPLVSLHKWSGQTKYDDISGPSRIIYAVINGFSGLFIL